MDERGGALVRASEEQLRLPPHLRTENWFNDWQHAVFVVSFDHLTQALRDSNAEVAKRLVDQVTVYLFVHFLCEEEGMTWAAANRGLRREALRSHQAAHLRELESWHETVQAPFGRAGLRDRTLPKRARDFYERILQHIETMDQECYGSRVCPDEQARLDEAAHVAQSGLPLSPFMAGAARVVDACDPRAYGLLMRQMLPSGAAAPLRPLSLFMKDGGLADDGLRARFLKAMRVPGGKASAAA